MRRLFTLGLLAAAFSLLTAGSALAVSPGWHANPGTTYSNGVVTLDSNNQPFGTSYENSNLEVPVANGDTISFEYNGPCGGGAPRVFIQGGAYNTWDPNPAQCPGTSLGGGWYQLTGTVSGIVNGNAGYTGIVNDNTSNPSVIQVRNLKIGGTAVNLAPAPTSKDGCKKDGWQNGPYKNQGQCVSSFNH